ncbi:MAG TPA: dihydrolipoyl dehydrogenase [Dehalococcoidia bacterium]|nr:dihydrolipoyl dehydrogenase [Dehalococcoidia bacterium]
MDEFDVVVIGGGTGGYTAAIRATQLGLTAAIIERSKIGGTCLHRGCIPTKAWLESAEVLSLARKAATFGVKASDVTMDFPTVSARQKQVVDTLHKSIRGVIQKHKIEMIEGEGRFLSPTQVAVGERTLTAKNVIIATGSQPKEIPGLETDGKQVLNSDHLLELEELPKSIIIVGAGAIGCEFASFFADAGTEVTLIEMLPTVVPLEDPDVGKALEKALASRGINIMTSGRVLTDKTRSYDGVVELTVEHGGAEKTVQGQKVLMAVGRGAVTEGLGLEKTGVQVERGWVTVDEAYRTAEPNIYAIGDAIGGLLLAHVAAAEGFIAAEAIAGKDAEKLDYTRVPRVTYSRPQVAAVGLSEQQAKDAGHNVKTQRFSFKYNAMALIQDETDGFAKVVYDADAGDLLGVHIIGPHACELISEASLGRFLQASGWELGTNIHPHPTLSETLGEAAQLSAGISIYW